MSVRVRFAPSPTGELHIGGLRTALFCYLFARKNRGVFILRIEDTDRKRYDPHSADHIQFALRWAGLNWDEGPIFQSQRLEIYKKHALELMDAGHAYPCFCSPERLEEMRKEQETKKLPPRYDRRCRNLTEEERDRLIMEGAPFTIRMKVPESGITKFKDIVYGEISVRNEEIDDQVLLKSDGYPTYHLAHLVDDHLMEITHVIRGEEWLPSTPKHVLLYQAFGWEMPEFCHLPSILAGKGQGKLSKRHGAVSVISYMEEGYLPEALINFLALLGWSPGTDQEIFSMEELIEQFSLEKVSHTGAVFNRDKLDFFNGYYIRKKSLEELAILVKPYLVKAGLINEDYPLEPYFFMALRTVQERMKKLSEAPELLSFYFKEPDYPAELLIPKKGTPESAAFALEVAIDCLTEVEDFAAPVLERELRQAAQEKGIPPGNLLWPLRAALTGKEASPGAFEVLEVLGKDESLLRLEKALFKLKK
jgi:glutamyl-tRNA synthetase